MYLRTLPYVVFMTSMNVQVRYTKYKPYGISYPIFWVLEILFQTGGEFWHPFLTDVALQTADRQALVIISNTQRLISGPVTRHG